MPTAQRGSANGSKHDQELQLVSTAVESSAKPRPSQLQLLGPAANGTSTARCHPSIQPTSAIELPAPYQQRVNSIAAASNGIKGSELRTSKAASVSTLRGGAASATVTKPKAPPRKTPGGGEKQQPSSSPAIPAAKRNRKARSSSSETSSGGSSSSSGGSTSSRSSRSNSRSSSRSSSRSNSRNRNKRHTSRSRSRHRSRSRRQTYCRHRSRTSSRSQSAHRRCSLSPTARRIQQQKSKHGCSRSRDRRANDNGRRSGWCSSHSRDRSSSRNMYRHSSRGRDRARSRSRQRCRQRDRSRDRNKDPERKEGKEHDRNRVGDRLTDSGLHRGRDRDRGRCSSKGAAVAATGSDKPTKSPQRRCSDEGFAEAVAAATADDRHRCRTAPRRSVFERLQGGAWGGGESRRPQQLQPPQSKARSKSRSRSRDRNARPAAAGGSSKAGAHRSTRSRSRTRQLQPPQQSHRYSRDRSPGYRGGSGRSRSRDRASAQPKQQQDDRQRGSGNGKPSFDRLQADGRGAEQHVATPKQQQVQLQVQLQQPDCRQAIGAPRHRQQDSKQQDGKLSKQQPEQQGSKAVSAGPGQQHQDSGRRSIGTSSRQQQQQADRQQPDIAPVSQQPQQQSKAISRPSSAGDAKAANKQQQDDRKLGGNHGSNHRGQGAGQAQQAAKPADRRDVEQTQHDSSKPSNKLLINQSCAQQSCNNQLARHKQECGLPHRPWLSKSDSKQQQVQGSRQVPKAADDTKQPAKAADANPQGPAPSGLAPAVAPDSGTAAIASGGVGKPSGVPSCTASTIPGVHADKREGPKQQRHLPEQQQQSKQQTDHATCVAPAHRDAAVLAAGNTSTNQVGTGKQRHEQRQQREQVTAPKPGSRFVIKIGRPQSAQSVQPAADTAAKPPAGWQAATTAAVQTVVPPLSSTAAAATVAATEADPPLPPKDPADAAQVQQHSATKLPGQQAQSDAACEQQRQRHPQQHYQTQKQEQQRHSQWQQQQGYLPPPPRQQPPAATTPAQPVQTASNLPDPARQAQLLAEEAAATCWQAMKQLQAAYDQLSSTRADMVLTQRLSEEQVWVWSSSPYSHSRHCMGQCDAPRCGHDNVPIEWAEAETLAELAQLFPDGMHEGRPVQVCIYNSTTDEGFGQLSLLEAVAYFLPCEQPLQPGRQLSCPDGELQALLDNRLQVLVQQLNQLREHVKHLALATAAQRAAFVTISTSYRWLNGPGQPVLTWTALKQAAANHQLAASTINLLPAPGNHPTSLLEVERSIAQQDALIAGVRAGLLDSKCIVDQLPSFSDGTDCWVLAGQDASALQAPVSINLLRWQVSVQQVSPFQLLTHAADPQQRLVWVMDAVMLRVVESEYGERQELEQEQQQHQQIHCQQAYCQQQQHHQYQQQQRQGWQQHRMQHHSHLARAASVSKTKDWSLHQQQQHSSAPLQSPRPSLHQQQQVLSPHTLALQQQLHLQRQAQQGKTSEVSAAGAAAPTPVEAPPTPPPVGEPAAGAGPADQQTQAAADVGGGLLSLQGPWMNHAPRSILASMFPSEALAAGFAWPRMRVRSRIVLRRTYPGCEAEPAPLPSESEEALVSDENAYSEEYCSDSAEYLSESGEAEGAAPAGSGAAANAAAAAALQQDNGIHVTEQEKETEQVAQQQQQHEAQQESKQQHDDALEQQEPQQRKLQQGKARHSKKRQAIVSIDTLLAELSAADREAAKEAMLGVRKSRRGSDCAATGAPVAPAAAGAAAVGADASEPPATAETAGAQRRPLQGKASQRATSASSSGAAASASTDVGKAVQLSTKRARSNSATPSTSAAATDEQSEALKFSKGSPPLPDRATAAAVSGCKESAQDQLQALADADLDEGTRTAIQAAMLGLRRPTRQQQDNKRPKEQQQQQQQQQEPAKPMRRPVPKPSDAEAVSGTAAASRPAKKGRKSSTAAAAADPGCGRALDLQQMRRAAVQTKVPGFCLGLKQALAHRKRSTTTAGAAEVAGLQFENGYPLPVPYSLPACLLELDSQAGSNRPGRPGSSGLSGPGRQLSGQAGAAAADAGRRGQRSQLRAMVKSEIALSEAAKWKNLVARSKKVVFQRSGVHGWGLFAGEEIAADDFVIEYIGELIRPVLSDPREKMYQRQGQDSSYLFRIDGEWVADATVRGGRARFINHSCDPNCYTKIFTVDGTRKIGIYALKNIALGQELAYDYKFEYEDESNRVPCCCGAKNCRGWMN